MPDSKNILSGPVRVLLGNPANGTSPDVLPADTVALGAVWGGTWRDVGFTTDDGAHLILEQAYNEVPVAQQRSPALMLPGVANERVTANLLEATLENIMAALGRGAITTVAAGSGTPGNKRLTISEASAVRYTAVGLEGVAPPNTDGQARRVLVPVAIPVSAVDLQMAITTQMGVPVEFRSLGGATSPILIHDVLKALP